MSSPGSSSSVFSSLPARPPTPPRDISSEADDALRFLQEGHQEKDTIASRAPVPGPLLSTDTPPLQTPTSSQARSSTNAKRVDFSPWPTYHKIPHLGQPGSPHTRAIRQTSLSRAVKPLKSILKPAVDRLPPTPDELSDSKLSYFSPQEPGSFRKMLQSVLRQLESTSRDARRDAYLALNGALKAYEGVPEPQAIVEKIKPLMQFITRDMAWKDTAGRLDSNVVTQALTLTCALMYNPHTAYALDDDFRCFLVDRSHFVIDQVDMPKAILKSHMFLLCQQRFSTSIMTALRAEKLITALQTVQDRCTGNSVYSARMVIYNRLLEQAPGTMLTRMRDWIEHVFHGVMSTSKDLRTRAIETCTAAGLILGQHQQATKVLYEVCEKEVDGAESYGDFLNLRLMQMTGDKEVAEFVPQIWSAVIMFFRCKRKPVEKWPRFRTWLLTIQKSLNSGDLAVKHQANIAWNRLVFTVMPDSTTTETMRSMLKVPIVNALEKRGNDKHSHQLRQFALDSYCNLLHYALRPELSHEDLDMAWDMYVSPVLALMAKSSSRGQLNACRILHGLLEKSGGNGSWNANAVNESEAIKPEELPRLDPRWLRSRLGKVIEVLEPMVIAGMQRLPKNNEHIDRSWSLLTQAVAEAGSQEVKTSNELKVAIAQLTNFFRRIWSASVDSSINIDTSAWFSRYRSLLQLTVETIGAGHFIEDILHKTVTDDVEAAPTPSHRPSKHPTPTHSPFVFLFALYFQPPPSLQIDNNYQESAAWQLRLLSRAKGSACGVLALLHRAVQFASQSEYGKETFEVAGLAWIAVADLAQEILQKQSSGSPHHDTNVMGVAFRSALNIFIDGLAFASGSSACMKQLIELYSTVCKSARHHAGDGGVVLGVMEPLSILLLEKTNEVPIATLMRVIDEMLKNGVWPRNRQELDRSRKALWVISLELPKGSTFDPFDGVYKLLDHVIEKAYKERKEGHECGLLLLYDCFAMLIVFLRRCPIASLSATLSKIQRSLSAWIKDEGCVVFQNSNFTIDDGMSETFETARILDLWSNILDLLTKIPRKDTLLLESLDKLLVAGFSSPSKAIVNSTIVFWNQTFGTESLLTYPSSLQPVLRARREQTAMCLPGFPEDFSDMDVAVLPAFGVEESQFAPSVPRFAFAPALRVTKQSAPLQPAENTLDKQPLIVHGLSYDAVAVMGRSSASPAPARSKPGPRLLHEDSQINFAPSESLHSDSSNEESQLLTDHQREVRERQHGDAQMFPDLSSSPAGKSTAASKRVAKKLDFTSDRESSENGDVNVTPTGPADTNPMSDDLPSSPTPRPGAAARDANGFDAIDEDAYETDCDPPSSPPRHKEQAAQLPLQGASKDNDEVTTLDSSNIVSDLDNTQVHACFKDVPIQAAGSKQSLFIAESDLPSDTMLPTAQLQREAAAAAESEPAVLDSLTPADKAGLESQVSGSQFTPLTPSRIENTIVEAEADQALLVNTNSPKSINRSKKRKRSSDTVFTSKKRKQSPFKSFLTGLLGRSQEEEEEQEEEDIDDEIVVASSQGPDAELSTPPHTNVASHVTSAGANAGKIWSPQVLVSPPAQAATEISQPQETQEQQISELGAEPEISHKRGRGRPKRNKSSRDSSTVPPLAIAGVKRPASAVDAAGTETLLASSTSRIEDTPAPPKTRKQRRAECAAQNASQNTSQSNSQATNIPSAGSQHEGPSAEQQLGSTQSTSTIRGRKIAKPISLMGKLKGALAECKKMILGSDEDERAIDDLMFEIRREVFEARRRGRAEWRQQK